MDSARPDRWSVSQRACLAEMGFRHWQSKNHRVAASATAPTTESLWLWPAVTPEGAVNLAFALAQAEPASGLRRLLGDIARHFSLALPASPQPVAAVGLSPAALLLGFEDVGECLEGQITLPSLHALLEADVTARRACWQTLSPLIARQAQGGEP